MVTRIEGCAVLEVQRVGAARGGPASVGMVDENSADTPSAQTVRGEIVSDVTGRVLFTVSSIPSGHVVTYGDGAGGAGTGARAVGQILRNGGHDVPWWRVVDATGRPVRAAAHAALAEFLRECTPLAQRGDDVRVDLAHASWRSHDAVSDT